MDTNTYLGAIRSAKKQANVEGNPFAANVVLIPNDFDEVIIGLLLDSNILEAPVDDALFTSFRLAVHRYSVAAADDKEERLSAVKTFALISFWVLLEAKVQEAVNQISAMQEAVSENERHNAMMDEMLKNLDMGVLQ